MHACVRDRQGKNSVGIAIDLDTVALGISRHLASVYLNVLADDDPSNPMLFSRTFLQQLFTRLAHKRLHSKTRKLECAHLDQYLSENPLSDYVLEKVSNFPLRPRDSLCGSMMTAIKAHVSGNFESRVM